MRDNVTKGEIPFRMAWLQAIVDRVAVGADVFRIIGDKASLGNRHRPRRLVGRARSSQSCPEMARPAGIEPAFSA